MENKETSFLDKQYPKFINFPHKFEKYFIDFPDELDNFEQLIKS